MTETEAPTATEEAQPPPPLPPLVVRKGTRFRQGHRHGTVIDVRGGSKQPYDLMVRWEGEKYPQWLIFNSFERDYNAGRLELVS